MGVFSTLLWSTVIFLVASFAGFTSFRVRNNYQKAMTYLNAASTGVILAAAFTHLLPDAINDLDQFDYPVAPAMALTGFLLLVLIETALHSHNLHTEHRIAELEHENHNCEDHDNEFGAEPVHNFLIGVPSSSFVKVKDKVEGNKQCPTLERQCSENAKRRRSLTGQNSFHGDISNEGDVAMDNFHNENLPLLEKTCNDDHSHHHNHSHHHESTDKAHNLKKRRNSITTTAASTSLWLALVMHSIMEGIGIGVTDNALKQSTLVVAILIHKGFASMALASALLESGLGYQSFLAYFLAFALASPAGAVGACFISTQNHSTVLSGLVTGLASGSFMYIGFMEMLPAMLTTCQHMADAMFLFVASAIAMAALAAFV